MGKYENIFFAEYQEKKLKMLNDLGRTREYCEGVECIDCPLYYLNNSVSANCEGLELTHPETALEIVMEYIPKAKRVDWSKVSVDTKVLVKAFDGRKWRPRYFAKYENGLICTWDNGCTSFTSDGNFTGWDKAKLYEEGMEE